MKKKLLRFDESIKLSLKKIMKIYPNIFYFGLGADDSARVFNTTIKSRTIWFLPSF